MASKRKRGRRGEVRFGSLTRKKDSRGTVSLGEVSEVFAAHAVLHIQLPQSDPHGVPLLSTNSPRGLEQGESRRLLHCVFEADGFNKKTQRFGEPLAPTTASRRLRTVKSIFKRAGAHEWIRPYDVFTWFSDMPIGEQTNDEREDHVEEAVIQARLAANRQQLVLVPTRVRFGM